MTDEVDMAKHTIAKSDQLNADDLGGGPRIVTITRVREAEGDQPVAVHFEGDDNKPFKPCKSMRRVMMLCWGKYASAYVGKSMELYRDPDVQFGGMKVGGIRISRMSHIDGDRSMALTAGKGGKKGMYKVRPLTDAPNAKSDPPVQDFSDALAGLKALARPGNVAALQDQWQTIGADARKALAGELPALKAACEQPQPADTDDVPFDAPAQEGNDYDGV